MTTQVTQCPQCKTSFRVTEAQLSIANGAVRCGSCLHIFNAEDHWLNNPAFTQASTAEIDLATPTAEALDTTAEHDDGLINDTVEQGVLDNIFDDDLFADDDLDLLASEVLNQNEAEFGLATKTEPPEKKSPNQEHSEQKPPGEENPSHPVFDDTLFSDDELIADTSAHSIINTEDDLDELIQDNVSSDIDSDSDSDSDFSDSFLELDEQEENPLAVFKELDEIGEDNGLEEDDWARKLLEEEDEDSSETDATTTETETGHDNESEEEPLDPFSDIFDSLEDESPAIDPELLDILNERDDKADHAPAPVDEFILSSEPMMAGERIGEDTAALLANIEPEPVEIDTASHQGRWLKRAWSASIAAAFILFVAQYLIFNFDRLSRNDS